METYISITIGKNKVQLHLTADNYDWKLHCNNDEIDFHGYICNGCYSYNKKEVVIYDFKKEFTFFFEEIKSKVEKELKRSKIIK